jgi:hypothetical protein
LHNHLTLAKHCHSRMAFPPINGPSGLSSGGNVTHYAGTA